MKLINKAAADGHLAEMATGKPRRSGAGGFSVAAGVLADLQFPSCCHAVRDLKTPFSGGLTEE